MSQSYRQFVVKMLRLGYDVRDKLSGEPVRWDPVRLGHRWPWVDIHGKRYESHSVAPYDKITGERYRR